MSVGGAVQIVPAGRLVYGLQLPIVAQSTVFAQPWEAAAGTTELVRVAKACDRAGFFYIAACDHVAVPRSHAAAMSTVWYDTIATLGFLAAATKQVRLMSYVWIPAYRHPLMTAKAFLTLDARTRAQKLVPTENCATQSSSSGRGSGFQPKSRRSGPIGSK